MLYKFKSKACSDLIMLEASALRILEIIAENIPININKGILEWNQMQTAVHALERAIEIEENETHLHHPKNKPNETPQKSAQPSKSINDVPNPFDALDHSLDESKIRSFDVQDEIPEEIVSLRQRAVPFLAMLKESAKAKESIVWNV